MGIRRGADVLKAMALGAEAVLVGRPYLYRGLALGGEAGAREVLGNLLADLDLTLALSGLTAMSEAHNANLFAPCLMKRLADKYISMRLISQAVKTALRSPTATTSPYGDGYILSDKGT